MEKMLQMAFLAVVVIARDMFIGFIIGLCAAVALARLNPGTYRVVALLIPVGIAAGFVKGLSKFIFLNISSSIPSKGYRYEYPKFKILSLWLVILAAAMILGYGLNFSDWLFGPYRLLTDNIVLRSFGTGPWVITLIFVIITGIAAHIYEPPVNRDEVLPETEIMLKTEEDAR